MWRETDNFWPRPYMVLSPDFSQLSLGRFQTNFFVTLASKRDVCWYNRSLVNSHRKLGWNSEKLKIISLKKVKMMHYSRSKGLFKKWMLYQHTSRLLANVTKKFIWKRPKESCEKSGESTIYGHVKSCQFLVTSAKYAICIFIHPWRSLSCTIFYHEQYIIVTPPKISIISTWSRTIL